MANRWLDFVKEYRKKNPNLSYKEVLKRAKKDYKKEDKPKSAKSKAKSKPKKENVQMSIQERKIIRDKLFRDAQLEREKDEERKREAQRKGIKKETLDLVELLKGGNLAGGAIVDPKELFTTKAERAKLVRKYTEFKRAVQEGLRKGALNQKDFNNFMGLTRILQKTKNDKYAKDYKKISKEFKSKKYAKLRDRSTETLTAKSKKQLANLTRIMEKDVLFKGAQSSRAKAEEKLEQRKIEFILKQMKDKDLSYDQALQIWNATGKAKVISQLKLTED